MNVHAAPRKAVSLLLIVAMLTVLIAAIVPFVSTATVEEFENFSYQTPNDYDMIDATTSLRFVCTVPAEKVSGYTAAGFVLSKSVAEPTVGGEHCLNASTTTVYHAITADGKTEDAPDGRLWVAVKLVNIPQSYFDGTIYVRAYVTDGAGTRYSEAKEITVWGANAIEYFTKWEKSFWENKPYAWHDPDYTYTGARKDFQKPSFAICTSALNLGNDAHYYPTNENPDGNDLLVEFSFLYNEDHENLVGDSKVLAFMYMENYNVFNIDLQAGKISPKLRTLASDGGDDVLLYELPQAVDHKVSIGGYGWHRFGVRIHSEAEKNANGVDVDYTITATAYLDGRKIFEVDKTD